MPLQQSEPQEESKKEKEDSEGEMWSAQKTKREQVKSRTGGSLEKNKDAAH